MVDGLKQHIVGVRLGGGWQRLMTFKVRKEHPKGRSLVSYVLHILEGRELVFF
jgi:hypothetical protein